MATITFAFDDRSLEPIEKLREQGRLGPHRWYEGGIALSSPYTERKDAMNHETPAAGAWHRLTGGRPEEGAWVLMYLKKYGGVEKYRAGMYLGPDDWTSTANWREPDALLTDREISHWMLLPEPPDKRQK